MNCLQFENKSAPQITMSISNLLEYGRIEQASCVCVTTNARLGKVYMADVGNDFPANRCLAKTV